VGCGDGLVYCVCVFINLLGCCCVTFEVVLRPLLTDSCMGKFYCLNLG
jgi:hypothetical protein